MGFKISCQVAELGFYFQNFYGKIWFWKIILNVMAFKNTKENRPFMNMFTHLNKVMIFSEISVQWISFLKMPPPLHFLSKILIFSEILFKGISFVKLKPPHFFQQKCKIFTNFLWRVFFLFLAKFWEFRKFFWGSSFLNSYRYYCRISSLLLTVGSLACNVFKPSPTTSLPLPPGSSSASTRRGR